MISSLKPGADARLRHGPRAREAGMKCRPVSSSSPTKFCHWFGCSQASIRPSSGSKPRPRVSERRRSEAQRARLESQLRQQQRLESIGTLASGVAHEINNPVQGIMNYAELITGARASDAETAIRRAIDMGFSLIDTADAYGPGNSEALIGEALHVLRVALAIQSLAIRIARRDMVCRHQQRQSCTGQSIHREPDRFQKSPAFPQASSEERPFHQLRPHPHG